MHAEKYFAINGTITSHKNNYVTIFLFDGVLKPPVEVSVPVNNNGEFNQTFVVKNDLEIYFGDYGLCLFAQPDSSIEITWDDNNFFKTIQCNAKEYNPNKYLVAYQRELSIKRSQTLAVLDSATNETSFLHTINELNNEEFSHLKKFQPELDKVTYRKLAYNIFYSNLQVIMRSKYFVDYQFSDGLNRKYDFPFIELKDSRYDKWLSSKEAKNDSLGAEHYASRAFKISYSVVDSAACMCSRDYRYFIRYFFQHFNFETLHRNLGKDLWEAEEYNVWLKAMIKNNYVVEWLTADRISTIMQGQQKTDSTWFSKAITVLKDPELKEDLTNIYNKYSTLKNGNKAPDFALRDDRNNLITLSKFRGKNVFLSFWDNHCPPCIGQINAFSKRVAMKYKDSNIVFIYVFTNRDSKEWQTALKKFHPEGINVNLPEGFTDKIAADYMLYATPRYILIDTNGIIKNVAYPYLGELLNSNPFSD